MRRTRFDIVMSGADRTPSRLHAVARSVYETCLGTAAGPVGHVDSRSGETLILATAATQTGGWQPAREQAAAVGMVFPRGSA